jgi:hypothetical protein
MDAREFFRKRSVITSGRSVVDVEDGPKWTPTEVSTWGINGHFGAGSR